jgi:cellulose synthase/poly-beta-1,6-N-acetylglucosamine synthase-like glycosyltransferase
MSDGMNPPPGVSVVVPVYNAAADVGRLLESLAGLDWPADRLETIVVDNGSTDGTDRIVAGHPVKLLRETGIRSSYAARNRGIAEAGGEWIAFTDGDCAVSTRWLRELLAPPLPGSVGAVAGELAALELETPVQRLTERFGIMRHAVTMHHKSLPCFSTANVAIRREVLERLGGFREDVRFFGDMEFSWRMQIELNSRLMYRPAATVLHRHRRTFGDLWRQGIQHGRGVAYMKRRYPDRYRIRIMEQYRRLGTVLRSGAAALAGAGAGAERTDRSRAPLFLVIWYTGMGIGYLMGPARPSRTEETDS